MEIKESEKIDILLHLLNERYNASHKIRERSLRVAIWALGFSVAFVWILLEAGLSLPQKLILTLLVIILGGAIFWFLYSLEKGFEKNREVMIDIEEALGCYAQSLYLTTKPLYPGDYKKTETKSWYSHFRSVYLLLIPIALLIIFLIWFAPSAKHHDSTSEQAKQQSQTQTEKVERRK